MHLLGRRELALHFYRRTLATPVALLSDSLSGERLQIQQVWSFINAHSLIVLCAVGYSVLHLAGTDIRADALLRTLNLRIHMSFEHIEFAHIVIAHIITVLFSLSSSFVCEFNIRESNFSAFKISEFKICESQFPRHVITTVQHWALIATYSPSLVE